MAVFKSKINNKSDVFSKNKSEFSELIKKMEDIYCRAEKVSERRRQKFIDRGQLTPRERLSKILDQDTAFIELFNMISYLVDDDNRLSMCGGTIAQLYEDMGGKVYRYGKPYEPIYVNIEKKMKIKNRKKVLVIGDSLWHDICGGLKMGYDRLWIKKGIHKTQLKNNAELKPLLEKYPPTFAQNELKL